MELREMDGGKMKIVIYSAFHANVNKLMKMETKVSLTTNEVEWKKNIRENYDEWLWQICANKGENWETIKHTQID